MSQEQQRKINESLSELRFSNKSGSHLNCIRINSSSKGPHNDKIIELCKGYLELGIPFITEAVFTNGKRCDILLPATMEIIEVLHTETDDEFEKKIESYPDIFQVTKVRVWKSEK